jgi:hypothetical protein
MYCPACKADNPDTASRCTACNAPLSSAPRRRPRRRAEAQDEGPLSPLAEAHNREVKRLYKWCLLALVPFLSLVLAPVVAYRAHRYRRRAATDPALAGTIPVGFAFWLALCSSVASWLGVALMALGLYLG